MSSVLIVYMMNRADVDGHFDTGVLSSLIQHLIPVFAGAQSWGTARGHWGAAGGVGAV